MNWEEVAKSAETKQLLRHYQKLGQFRARHPAVGAGMHRMISAQPYVFERSYSKNGFSDIVVIGLNLPAGEKTINIGDKFKDGDVLFDFYSEQKVKVTGGQIKLNTPFDVILIARQGN